MTENELLQAQIDELKRTVDRLQSGETHFESMEVKARRIRNKYLEKYYGTWDEFRNSKIACTPTGKTWSDREFLRDGCGKLTNIIFKHGKDYTNSTNIFRALNSEEDLKEYEEIADYVVNCVHSKVKELRKRHGFSVN